MKKTLKQTLEEERNEFNKKDPNNQRSILGFMIDKKRNPENRACDLCSRAYGETFCTLCEYVIKNLNPDKLLNDFTYKNKQELTIN